MKLLLIEDNKEVAELIFDYMENISSDIGDNYDLDYAMSGTQGLWLASENRYDCIILDLMLPGLDGLSLCQQLRDKGVNTPIIMLTARDTNEDILAGLRTGADDYIVKPFDLEVLHARIETVMRRAGNLGFSKQINCGPLIIDVEARKVSREERSLNLNPSCFSILVLLAQKHPAPASREEIIDAIWKDDIPDDDILRKHIYHLRQIVDKPFGSPIIKTLPKVGYSLDF